MLLGHSDFREGPLRKRLITSSVEIPWHYSDGEGKTSVEIPIQVSSSEQLEADDASNVKWFVLLAPAGIHLHELCTC